MTLVTVWRHALLAAGAALVLPLVFIMLAGIGGNLVQHKPVLSTEQLMPKFSRLSPLAGFQRIFGKQALVNLVKGLAKLAAGLVEVRGWDPDYAHLIAVVLKRQLGVCLDDWIRARWDHERGHLLDVLARMWASVLAA